MTKQFTRYSKLQPQSFDLTRDDSGCSRVYRDTAGNVYQSVTSFLSQFSDGKEHIQKWKESIGEAEANRVLKAAGDRGTAIHLACEQLLQNQDWSEISMFYKSDFLVMKKHLESNVDNIFALEHQMYSKKLKLAGTCDLIAEYNGNMSLIDFKTATRQKYSSEITSYFLQCACYGLMAYERYGMMLKDIVILMVVEGDGAVHVFKEPMKKWIIKLIELKEQINENE